ncbi:Uncharacterized protein OS=Ruminococcus sp. CAG:108 GN=BN462_00245 PE=4 SV=1 [Gemmata massiliana]|uniref:Uncharacterized protein n=1 Tax=Gemmata massiliana TaxID=1210884 RepID=A0A6P2CZ61_9BACT|nr:hypothetical protein [Gemmata massiliana]VTR93415.1 Uncharacterized protein OS=Ruminococcus sp. CAG:108 GN=BN462_00245 PE=4 SV=1 [Gemmata massiliana]
MSHAPRPCRRANEPADDVGTDFFAQPGVELFRDQYGRHFTYFPVGDRFETHPLRGKRLLHALIRFYAGNGVRLNRRQARDRIEFAEAWADERTVELTNRSGCGARPDELWVDLTDDRWRAVRVTPGAWQVVERPPILFQRFAHQCPLPDPDAAGDLAELLDHLPQLAGEHDRLLLLAWVAAAWLPIPRPILIFTGTHGAAKSTATAFLRRVLDPSRAELLGKDARGDLPLTFQKHAVAAFDNVDALVPPEADLCCQAVTGRAIARRQLYTDADEFIFSFRRAVIINGLRLPTNRTDFLDRCLILDLERIAPERRVSGRRVEQGFELARPRIVGGLLNTLARAMQLLPGVSDASLGRMADFHHWGRAVALALGRTADAFDAAYRVAEGRQKRGAAENTLAQALLLFARTTMRWEGPATELYERLIETAQNRQLRRTPEFWPDSPVGLGRVLKQLGETLADYGVTVTPLRRTTTRRVQIAYDPAQDRLRIEDRSRSQCRVSPAAPGPSRAHGFVRP